MNTHKEIEENPLMAHPLNDELWRKSIPAQVFLNHFFAINLHLANSGSRYALNELRYFKQLTEDTSLNTDRLQKLLLNAWSTEYAMRSTALLGNDEYMRYALHWTFPQAFYSVFLSLQAFLHIRGLNSRSIEAVSREFGRMVANGCYPQAMSFYADSYYGNFRLHGIHVPHYKPGLFPAAHEPEACAQIAQFLLTTRRQKFWSVREAIQTNPETAIRSRTTGKILTKFSAENWKELQRYVSPTTLIDLMGRLRMSSSHKEIERFVQADIDFTLFHESLCEIVGYMNFVHESYIAKAIGLEAYRKLVESLPRHLKNGFVSRRLEEKIAPLFGDEPRAVRMAA